jgi:hypothetical protein
MRKNIQIKEDFYKLSFFNPRLSQTPEKGISKKRLIAHFQGVGGLKDFIKRDDPRKINVLTKELI